MLRAGQVSLEEAYAQIESGELWLVNMTIPGYESASWTNHAPKRQRKLLVHKRELAKLAQRVELKNKTLVPLKIYFNERGIAKVDHRGRLRQEAARQARCDPRARAETRHPTYDEAVLSSARVRGDDRSVISA